MSISNYYSKFASVYSSERLSALFHTSERIQGFLQLLHPKSRILDAGCGPGEEAAEIRKLGHLVQGLDVSSEMVQAFKRNCPGSDCIVGDFTDTPFLDNAFDAVFSSFSLVHSDRTQVLKALREFKRVSRPFGYIYIATGLALGESEKRSYVHGPAKGMGLEQHVYSISDLGKSKAQMTAKRLGSLNPFIDLEPMQCRVSPANIRSIFHGMDLVVDCSDNWETRYLLSDAAVELNVPLFHASAEQFVIQAFMLAGSERPCYRCLVPSVDGVTRLSSCNTLGVLPSVSSLSGAIIANEVIRFLVEKTCSLERHALYGDLKSLSFHRYEVQRDPKCIACGPERVGWDSLVSSGVSSEICLARTGALATSEIQTLAGEGQRIRVLHIDEEPNAFQIGGVDCITVPFHQALLMAPDLSREFDHLFFTCKMGHASAELVKILNASGISNVSVLKAQENGSGSL